jgi:hypothetical protein
MTQADRDTRAGDAGRAHTQPGQEPAAGLKARAEEEAEGLSQHVGARAGRLADTLDTMGQDVRDEERWLANALTAASRRLQGFADTAAEKGPGALRQDAEQFARERPAIFLAGAVATGMVLGRVLRSTAYGETGEPDARRSSQSQDGRQQGGGQQGRNAEGTASTTVAGVAGRGGTANPGSTSAGTQSHTDRTQGGPSGTNATGPEHPGTAHTHTPRGS